VVLVATALTAATPSIGATATGRLDGDPTRAALAAWWTLVCLATAALLVGLVQYAIARLGFERRIRMTPQEFADELRSLQSDKKVRLHGSPGRHRPRAMHDDRPTPQPETGGS
jgi:flagellar biosynthesis protein FlhB